MKYKRIQHINSPGHAHELTFSCYRKNKYLICDDACRIFIECLAKARSQYDFKLIAYVLMPDHVHLLILPYNLQYNISKILSGIKLPSSMRISKILRDTYNRSVPRLWQRGAGYDRNLINKKAIMASVEYLHANPVRRRLTESPEAWYWSSAAFYAGFENYPILVDCDVLASII